MPTPRSEPSLPADLEDAVLAILDGDDGARDAALAALMAEHPEHAPAVRRWLIAAGAIDGTLLSEPGIPAGDADARGPAPGLPPDAELPRRLGAYLLVEVLGRGGFGTVYRAEQQEPIRRPVAVKVLNPGMDSREVLARFAAEREALNRMDHPGIARLLDAGTTPHGRPFFVMELVEGPTLVAWCRRQQLPLRQRIELFLRVCDAMQHAHQKAVLHRDLSSNNVLVARGPDGVQPKIIDFGIAKSLADPLLQGGAMTFRGTLMGTPEFMSPEQAAGHADIDTRADVYALGVQLYELLTDQLPIPGVALRAQGIGGIAKIVQTHVPALPSAVAPPPRPSRLRGDLDEIVMKALAKDRDERYAGVGELAADLRDHLADRPVRVRPPTAFYRLQKFVRRNRAQSLAFAVAALGIVVALAVMAAALRMAYREAELKEDANRRILEKADAGFRLLANEERLATALAAERTLPPPWPANAPAYAEWRARATQLVGERQKVEERLRALDDQARAVGGELPDEVDRHLQRALERLQQRLDAFAGPDGVVAAVEARWRFGADVVAPCLERDAAAWRDAIAAIGSAQCYRGIKLEPLPGLVPLGVDPPSGLWQFLELRSHERDYPLPTRDAATGALVTDAGTGIVFVLVPPGPLAVGARRGQPGMDRNDDDAADDELHGGTVRLDPFLIACTELSTAQWSRIVGAPLAKLTDPLLPITSVDWTTARDALRAFGMALPTEAQWEYACRAGTETPWCGAADAGAAAAVGWFDGGLHRVGLLQANRFGLFDVHGNAAEWCEDELLPYQDFPARAGDGLRARAVTAPDAWRAVRGGAFYDGAVGCRATARKAHPPSTRDGGIGLRPVRRIGTPR